MYPVSETSVDDREYLGTWAHQLFDDFSKVDLERYSSLKTTQKIVCTVKMIFIGIGVGMLFNSMINLSAYFIGVRVLTLNQFLLSSILGGIYGFLEDRSTRGSAEAWCMGRRAAALAMA